LTNNRESPSASRPPPPEGGGLCEGSPTGQPRPSRSERERQRTKRRIWCPPIDSSSPEPIDTGPDSRPGTRHRPSNSANHRLLAPGPHRGSRGDVRSEASSPPAGGARGGRSSPRKTGGVWGTESPADARAVSPEPTSTEDSVFGGPPEGGGLCCGVQASLARTSRTAVRSASARAGRSRVTRVRWVVVTRVVGDMASSSTRGSASSGRLRMLRWWAGPL